MDKTATREYNCLFYSSSHAVGRIKVSVILHCLRKAIQFLIALRLPPSTYILNFLCGKTGSLHKALLLPAPVPLLSEGKRSGKCWSCKRNHHFFTRNVKWLTDFGLGYLADIFSKVDEVSLSFWGNQVMVFVVDDKIWAFKLKRVWNLEHLYSPPWAWQLLSTSSIFR